MDYKENDNLSNEEEESLPAELPLDIDEELDFQEENGLIEDAGLSELEQLAKKAKTQPVGKFSLKSRRAIEDHLEERRIRKELDYFFDDEFAQGEDKETK